MLRLYFILLQVVLICISASSQQNRIALLDLTTKSAESTDGNLYSAEHLLQVTGLPYFVTDSVEAAMNSRMILCSSNIETFTFSQEERDSLTSFVTNGGILFSTQLKDTLLFSLFGVSDYQYDTKRYRYKWVPDSLNPAFRWLDDPMETEIRLGDSSYADVIGTRSYVLTTASAMATFDDDGAALVKNSIGTGEAYNLGISWKDVFLRNQVSADYKASRSFSNSFEPGSDVFILFIRGLFLRTQPHAVWKHSSGADSKSTLIITHDVDATSAISELMNSFASYEQENNIRATFFVTTHYMHDEAAKNFWHGYEDDVRRVHSKGHELASHSVSHVPDFDIESIVPEGGCGNTELSYQPFYNGTFSEGVTVCGEVEVSKLLLERDAGAPSVRSFRSGYLAYNEKLLNALENNNYSFNSSHSANNVLTAFPFRGHKDLSMNGELSSVLELPNTISDVFASDPITENNYPEKVGTWLNAVERNTRNNAPNILMIHPNRVYKIVAMQNFLRGLGSGVRIVPLGHFGDFWNARTATEHRYEMPDDSTLIITIANSSLPLHPDFSLVVSGGMQLDSIRVQDEDMNEIPLLQSLWEGNDRILHSFRFSADYTGFSYEPEALTQVSPNYPNPFSSGTAFRFEVMETTTVVLKIYDATGRLVDTPLQTALEMGLYEYVYENPGLSAGLYFYEFSFNDQEPVMKKMIISGKK